MKLTLIIIVLFGVGARGYFLPSGPSPIRGHLQGRIWPGHEKTDGNRLLYHTPAFQQYLDYRGHGSLQNHVVEQPLYQQQFQAQYQPQYQQVVQPVLPESYQGLQYLTRPPVTAQTTIPLVVKFPNNEAYVVPVRAVYTLPSFLERIVQRVQGYYSVYNPVEDLTLDRPLFTPTTPTSVPEISSRPPQKIATTEKNKEKLQEEDDTTEAGDASTDTTTEGETGDSTDATPTESSAGDDSGTDSSGTDSSGTDSPVPDTPGGDSSGGTPSGGYTYDKPARSFNTRK